MLKKSTQPQLRQITRKKTWLRPAVAEKNTIRNKNGSGSSYQAVSDLVDLMVEVTIEELVNPGN